MATDETRNLDSDAAPGGTADPVFVEAAYKARADIGSDAAWEALEAYAAEHQQPDAVSRVYLDALSETLSPEDAESLVERALAFHEEWFGEDSAALLGVLRRALEIVPSASEWAFSRLTVAYTSSERWSDLLALYDAEIARAKNEARKVTLLEEASQAAKDFADAPDRAIDYLTELVRLRPDDAGQLRNLERLLERQERWMDLIGLVRERAERLPPAEARAARISVAQMYLERTAAYPEAVAELRVLLSDEGADASQAVALLESVVANQEAPDASRREAAELLRQRYVLEDRTADVVRTLGAALEFADRGDRAELLAEAAEGLAREERFDEAMSHYAQMLEIAPGDEKARESLRALAERTGQHARYAQILVDSAAAAGEGSVRARLRAEAADVKRGVLGDAEGAIALYREVLEEPARTDALALAAARSLGELYEAAGDREARLSMLETRATLEAETATRARVLRQAAALATEMGAADRALAAYRGLLELRPEDPRALDGMIALLEAEERYDELVEVLRQRVALELGAFQVRADLVRIASVESDKLYMVDASIATWLDISERFGEHADVVDALADLYERRERFTEQAELLARAAGREGEHLAGVRVRLGDTYRDRLAQYAPAVEAYRKALEANASDERARAGLAALGDEPEVRREAIGALAASYSSTDEWQPLLALLPQRLAVAEDDAARVTLYVEAAELEEKRAGVPGAALRSIAAALALRPLDERLERELSRLGELADAPGEVADALRVAATRATEDAHRRARLYVLEAELREQRLDDAAGAFDAYQHAFSAQPQQESLGRALVRLSGATGRYADAERSLLAAGEGEGATDAILGLCVEVQRLSPGRPLFETLMRLAERTPNDLDPLVEALDVAKAHLGDEATITDTVRRLYERSSALFSRGAEAAGKHSAAQVTERTLTELVERLEAGGDVRGAMARLVEGARLPLGREVTAELRARAAALAAGPIGDRSLAIDLYRDVLGSAPTHAASLRALGDLLAADGRLPELLGLRKLELSSSEDPERRLALRLSIASLVSNIEALGGRVEALQQNLVERPGHAETVAALTEVFEAQHRFGELTDMLSEQAAKLDGAAAAPLWLRAAELSEKKLEDVDRAIAAYRHVVEIGPSVPAVDALARIYGAHGEHAKASYWLERRLSMATDAERTPLALALARSLVAAGRAERLPEVLEQARSHDPTNEEIRSMLASHYRAVQANEPLAALLADSVEHLSNPAEVLGVVREAVSLYEGELARPERAIPLMERAIALAPEDLTMKRRLADALRAAGRLDDASVVLEALIEGFGRRRSAERAEVHFILGQVANEQGDHARALEQLDLATRMDMSNGPMLLALGRIAREAGDLDRAEKSYRTLLMIVRRRGADEPVEVSLGEVLYELHAVAKVHGDAEKAEELYTSALEASGQSGAEALRFATALKLRGAPAVAAEGLEGRLRVATEPAERAQLLGALARLLESDLDQPEAALDRRLDALRHGPAADRIHDEARALAARLEQTGRYVALIEQLIEGYRRREDSVHVVALLLRAGHALEEDAGALDEATTLYRRAETIAEGPQRVETRLSLARVSLARGDHEEQLRLYALLVEDPDVSEATRTDLTYRYAEAQLAAPDTLESGLITLRAAFEREPRHVAAAGVLAAAARATETPSDALLSFYEEVARGSLEDELILDYLDLASTQQGSSAALLREASERALSAGLYARAEATLERLVAPTEDGEPSATEQDRRWALARLAERREAEGDLDGCARWLRRSAELAPDPDERRALLLRIAALATREGGDLSEAAEAYRTLLADDLTEQAYWEPLLDVYARLGDEASLGDLVASLVDALLEPSARNVARLAKARFLVGLEDRSPDAVDVLQSILDEEPEHREAGAMLAELYERSGYDEELVTLLERQLDLARDTRDDEATISLSLKLGALLKEVRREDAMDVYRRALASGATSRALTEELLALFTPDHDPREVLEVQERRLSTLEGDEASRLALALASRWQELGDREGAERALGVGYDANPLGDEARERLEAMLREGGDASRLAAFLAKDAERVRGDASAFRARLFEVAALHRDQLGRPLHAAEVLRSAMGGSVDVEVLAEIVACLELAGQGEAAYDELTSALEAHGEADETRVSLLRLRAGKALGQGDVVPAIRDLEEAYAIAPSIVAPDLVDALYSLRAAAELGGDRREQREASLRLVELHQAMGDAASARDALASWVNTDPTDLESLVRLRDIDVAAEDWPAVILVSSRMLGVTSGDDQVAAVLLLADAADAIGDYGVAREALERVLQREPQRTELIHRLGGVYDRLGAHRELAALLLTEAASTEDEQTRFDLYCRAGKLLIEQVGDLDSALPAITAAQHIRPDDHAVTLLLIDAYTHLGQHADAGQLIEQAMAAHTKRRSPELSQLQHRMARLARASGDSNLDLQWMNAALDCDKNNVEVAAELSELAIHLGDHETALNALRAITLSKNEGPMSRAMAFLLQARIAYSRGEARRALLWARKAKSEDPELEEASDFLRELGEA